MDEELHDLLIGARAAAIMAFTQEWEGSLFDNWVQTTTSPRGYIKDFAQADGGAFEQFQGEFNVNRLVHRSYQIIVNKYGKVMETPKLDFQQLLAWLGNEYPGILANVAKDAAARLDRLVTALVKAAIDPDETNGNLFNDSVFYGNVDLPASGAAAPAVTVVNKVLAKARTATGIRNAYYAGKKLFSGMRQPNGELFHSAGVSKEGFELMYATSDEQVVNAVFDNGQTTSRDTKDKITKVVTTENSLFDGEDMDVMLLRPVRRRGMAPFQVVKRTDNPQFESDFPPAAPNGFATAEQQRLQKYTSSATLEMEAGFGSIYDSVAIILPPRT